MTIDQLRTFHKALPFKPFRVHLADGRHLDVDHPEYLAQSPLGRTITVYRNDDTCEVIDLLLVTSLEVLNGHAKRSRSRGR